VKDALAVYRSAAMIEKESYRCLVVVKLESRSNLQRITEAVPPIMDTMKRLARADIMPAFQSKDGLLFGIFFQTTAPMQAIRAEFEKCDGTRNGDHMMAFDIGEKLTGTSGFSRAWTWLQHHPAK
jgi:hypothetical protein